MVSVIGDGFCRAGAGTLDWWAGEEATTDSSTAETPTHELGEKYTERV